MSTYTNNLNLFKYDIQIDAKQPFSIDKALNNNWDIIDNIMNLYKTGSRISLTISNGVNFQHQYIECNTDETSITLFTSYINTTYQPIIVPHTTSFKQCYVKSLKMTSFDVYINKTNFWWMTFGRIS